MPLRRSGDQPESSKEPPAPLGAGCLGAGRGAGAGLGAGRGAGAGLGEGPGAGAELAGGSAAGASSRAGVELRAGVLGRRARRRRSRRERSSGIPPAGSRLLAFGALPEIRIAFTGVPGITGVSARDAASSSVPQAEKVTPRPIAAAASPGAIARRRVIRSGSATEPAMWRPRKSPSAAAACSFGS